MIHRLTCPTCAKEVVPERTKAMPFCSDRCRLIDLGRWVTEEIGIPVDPDQQEDDFESPESAQEGP